MPVVRMTRSDKPEKKYKIVIEYREGQRPRTIHFGAKNMDDYVGTDGNQATDQQRKSYRARHKSGASAKFDTANAMSYYILWGNSRSVRSNFNAYKKRFNLK
tara:strand:- start:494 stop:799 length:306 start_codon:yes stop_codon:yes gene_type:complete